MRKFKMTNVIEIDEDNSKVTNLYKLHDDFIRLASKYGFKCSGELVESK